MKIENNKLVSVGLSDIIKGKITIPNSVTSIGDGVFDGCSSLNELKLKKKLNVIVSDGYLFIVKSNKVKDKINIFNGSIFNNMSKGIINEKSCYLVSNGTHSAHGDSIKQALEDLHFKAISERLKKKPIKANTIITLQYYRIITGACQTGCENWIEQNNITKDKYRAKDLLVLLEKTNAYGLENFKKLITF